MEATIESKTVNSSTHGRRANRSPTGIPGLEYPGTGRLYGLLLHQLAGSLPAHPFHHQKITIMFKRFFKRLYELAFLWYAVCEKHEQRGNSYRIRACIIDHRTYTETLHNIRNRTEYLRGVLNLQHPHVRERMEAEIESLTRLAHALEDGITPIWI